MSKHRAARMHRLDLWANRHRVVVGWVLTAVFLAEMDNEETDERQEEPT